MFKNIINKYRNLKLQRRVIIAVNITLIISLSVISVIATINRQNTQYRDAENTLFTELDYLRTILDITSDKELESIKEVFYEKVFYTNGYASFIHRDGRVLIDNNIEGQNVSAAPFFRSMTELKRGNISYTDPDETRRGMHRKHIYFTYYEPKQSFIAATVYHKDLISDPVLNTLKILLFALVFTLIIFSLVNYYVIGSITKPIKGLVKMVKRLAKGQLPDKYEYSYKNEVGEMVSSFNELVDGIKRTAVFANEIGKNNFDHEFTPLSDEDVLGNALLDMRQSLKKAAEEENVRKLEDEKRNWTTQGLAKFADILRQNTNDIEELSYNIISSIVEYMDINQGGIFILVDDDESDKYLELSACYAFDRRKFLEKKIKIGEGLVGTCVLEGQTIYLTKIPQNYIRITSGLGDENPSSLLIVPLKVNDEIFGVIELASFKKLEDHQVEFVEKIGESIASTISNVKINNNTAVLLEKSQQQAEEMRAQEEEMRQNMEELSATQEAMAEKDRENQLLISELNNEKDELSSRISEKEEEIDHLKKQFSPSDPKQKESDNIETTDETSSNTETEEKDEDISDVITDEEVDSDNIEPEDVDIADENTDSPDPDVEQNEDEDKEENNDDEDANNDDLLKGSSETQQEWEKHLDKSGKKFKKTKKTKGKGKKK